MPPKDLHHTIVRNALRKAGWIITHDPFPLSWRIRSDLLIDLGAEEMVVAEQAQRKIAVEVKSFAGSNDVAELQRALGQYILYFTLLEEIEPDRILYLAIPESAYREFFAANPSGDRLIANSKLRLVVFNVPRQEVVQWRS